MYSIIIDGPTNAGKSTIATMISKKFGYYHIDINMIRRMIAYYVSNVNFESKNAEKVLEKILPKLNISIKFINKDFHYFIDKEDVTDKIIRDEYLDTIINFNIVNSEKVKTLILNFVKTISEKTNVIIEGTNINYYMLPNTTHKIFLTASIEKRADRKCKKSFDLNSDHILDFHPENFKTLIMENDTKIKTIPSKDSVIIDNSKFNINETIEEIMKIIQFNKTFSCICANTVGNLKKVLDYVPDTKYIKFGSEKYGFEVNKAKQDRYSLILQSSDIDYIFKEIVSDNLNEFSFGKKTTNYKEYRNALNNISITDIINLLNATKHISINKIEEIKKVLVPFEHFIKSVQTKERCPKCGAELYKSDLPQYNYVCVACDENF